MNVPSPRRERPRLACGARHGTPTSPRNPSIKPVAAQHELRTTTTTAVPFVNEGAVENGFVKIGAAPGWQSRATDKQGTPATPRSLAAFIGIDFMHAQR